MYNVAYCFDKKYQQHFGASVMSLLLNYRGDASLLQIFAITDQFDSQLEENVGILNSMFKSTIKVLVLSESILNDIVRLPLPRFIHVSMASYFRLFLPQILPEDVEKVLYLDCDTIILDSVTDLIDTDLAGNAVAGISEMKPLESSRRIGTKNYINTGVLVLDLAAWRKDNISQQCIDWLVAYPEKAKYSDQCAINATNDNRTRLLDEKWNRYVFSRENAEDGPGNSRILHFVASDKPWHSWYDNPLGSYYWKYLGVSPWKAAQAVPPGNIMQAHKLARTLMRQGRAAESVNAYEGILAALMRKPDR